MIRTGSYLNAVFKGNTAAEPVWFAPGDAENGHEAIARTHSSLLHVLTRLGRSAAQRFGQHPGPGPGVTHAAPARPAAAREHAG